MTKWLDILISAVFTAALFLFFALVLPYHLVFTENYQMFLFTSDYFVKTVLCPGGLSDYLSRFLTQFFIGPWAGAAILAGLISSVQRLSWHLTPCRQPGLYPLSYIPALILVAFHCDYMAMLSASVSILASLAALKTINSISDERKRIAITAVLAAVTFSLFGSIAVMFIIPVIVRTPKAAAVLLPIAVLCPVTAWLTAHYPLDSLIRGLHYYGTDEFPCLAWAAAAAAMIFHLLKCCRSNIFRILLTSVFTISVGCLLIGLSLKRHNSIEREQSFKYVFLLRDKKWDTILDEYKKDGNPNSVFAVASHNLALGVNGRLAEEMFDFPQLGTDGLLPEYQLDYLMPFFLSGIYFELGMVNEAQRFAFEAMQSIPYYQRSAQCCIILACTAWINGDYTVAEKYHQQLNHTLFYRKSAFMDVKEKNKDQKSVPESREKRLEQKDLFYSGRHLPEMLCSLYEKSKGNTLALQYLMGYLMLQGDTGSFSHCYETYFDKEAAIPEAYAQVLMADWTKSHRSFDGMTWNISKADQDKCSMFMDDVMSKKSKSYLKTKYEGSYLFYLLYLKRN